VAEALKRLEFRFSVSGAGRNTWFRGPPTPVFRDMRKRTFRDFARVGVWLLAAGTLSVGCAKSSSEGAAPSVTPAAAPSAAAPPGGVAAPAPPPAAPAAAASAAPQNIPALPRAESAPEAHHAGPSTLTKDQATARRFREPLNTIAEAQAALEHANRELVALYTPAAGKEKAGAASENGLSESQRCDIACKAFASLERAADAVCRLAGERDARCKHARHLVDVNRERVASCNCPSSP
jgi:hypothetical protein